MPTPSECYFQNNDVQNGLHALIIGVSNYPFIKASGLTALSGPALSAIQFANWLMAADNLSFPLKSVRVLASPTSSEAVSVQDRAQVKPAVLENVSRAAHEWQRDVAKSTDGAALFYFAGHGIQRSRGDAVLLLEDFLHPDGGTDLERTISVNNVYNGMANFAMCPELAKTQFYFIDACRADLDQLHLRNFETQEPTPVFKIELGGVDDRTAPIFFAAAAGKNSWTQSSGTLFWQDLRACLDGMGAEQISMEDGDKWVVTISKLNDSLARLVNQFNRAHGFDLRSLNIDKFDPRALTTTIRKLNQAPTVPCEIGVSPSEVFNHITATFDLPTAEKPAALPFDGPRASFERLAGYYSLSAQVHPTYPGQYHKCEPVLKSVMPPSFNYCLRF